MSSGLRLISLVHYGECNKWDHGEAAGLAHASSPIPFFVLLDQTRVARDIGGEDRREPTFDAGWPCGLRGVSR
jgi:hypothetical protein